MKNVNILKRIVALVLIVAASVLLIPWNSKAATTCIVRAPFNGTVMINGVKLTDADVIDYGFMDGRIQRIAAEKYSVVCKYKDYKVTVGNLNEIKVFDQYNTQLTYTIVGGNVLDYTSSSDPQFMAAIESRIKGAAIAYHNRVGGYSTTGFEQYILTGSDAYVKCVGSDAGRKWGQYMKAPNITAINVYEVFRYSPDIFSAKVNVYATGTGQEAYSIYLLFRKYNGNYYVTDFTYQD